jgi:hypothetical protein
MNLLLTSTIELPVPWIIASIATLGTVIVSLAGIVYKILTDRLDAQDRLIEHLKLDVERMRKGCGHDPCFWKP